MKIKAFKIERFSQIASHLLYIVLGIWKFYGNERPFYYYPLLMISTAACFMTAIWISNFFFEKKESPFSLTPYIMAGTIMLNLEAYSFWTYALAGLFGVLSRAFLRTPRGHIFNPGFFGVFILAMTLPSRGTFALGLWQSHLAYISVIMIFGNFVVYRARRLGVCYGYVGGFTALAIFANFSVKILNIKFNGLQDVPALFWPSTLLTASSLIFIFHVISDPKTSPQNLWAQILFGLAIGVFDFVLRLFLIFPAEAISYLGVQVAFALLVNVGVPFGLSRPLDSWRNFFISFRKTYSRST